LDSIKNNPSFVFTLKEGFFAETGQLNANLKCHSRNPECFRESGILLNTSIYSLGTKKDSGQAGMTLVTSL
jgi:hypothetical protein